MMPCSELQTPSSTVLELLAITMHYIYVHVHGVALVILSELAQTVVM